MTAFFCKRQRQPDGGGIADSDVATAASSSMSAAPAF
jgi:hypothetical protein